MMNGMLEKLQEMQSQMEASKQKLNELSLEGEAGSGTIKVTVNGNRVVKQVRIDPMLLEGSSSEEIEDLLIIAMNRALEKAEKAHEEEMQQSARSLLPGMI